MTAIRKAPTMRTPILSVLLFVFWITGCDSASPPNYDYQPPEQLGDGIEVGSLEAVGVDASTLGRAVDRIRRGKYGEVHSLLIYMDGRLILEEYFPGHRYQWNAPAYHGDWVSWDRGERHTIMSAGKSVTSACVGLAIDHGFIENAQQSIFDYLPEHQRYRADGKDAITIEHLLTMSSGLAWKEWGSAPTHPESDLFRLFVGCGDQVACVLEKPLVHEPGSTFDYNTGGTVVLGEIVKNATGMDIEAFADDYLFAPMGIDPVEWVRFSSGVTYSGGDQRMTPREMLKFGVTHLNNGIWNGQQLIAEDWVERSSVPYRNNTGIRVPDTDGGRKDYSYGWWLWSTTYRGEEIDLLYALGWGGQKIMVIPDLDSVVVFTGANYVRKTRNFAILEQYVLPALHTVHPHPKKEGAQHAPPPNP